MPNLRKVDEQLTSIEKKFLLSRWLNPSNLAQEKERFLNDKYYQPVFKYPIVDLKNVKKDLTFLDGLKIDSRDCPIRTILAGKKDLLIEEAKTILSLGTDDFWQQSKKLWPEPDLSLLPKAENIVRRFYRQPKLKGQKLTEKEIERTIKKELADNGLHLSIEWKANLASPARVAEKSLKIRKGTTLNKRQLMGLINHEIKTHLFRRLNGYKQEWQVFQSGTSAYELLEEGMATAHKMFFYPRPFLRSVSLLFLAVIWGEKMGFRQVFNRLIGLGVGQEDAFFHTLRAKIGGAEMTKSGSLHKQILYLQGFCQYLQFVKSHKNFDFSKLYVAKIGFWELKHFDKISWQTKNLLLPDFIKDKSYNQKVLQVGKFNKLI